MSENDAECVSPDPASTVTDRLNSALNSSGSGFILRLCPSREYLLLTPLFFSAQDQEISTLGYPLGGDRATLVVNGPVSNGTGHTTAVDGTCPSCSGVKLRNIQINGTRSGAPPTEGGANIEMGGSTSGQLIEHVASYNPRSWSCLHIAEGSLDCNNVTVQHNDIGPCGTDDFQQWADGISMSCRNSLVRNNTIVDPTDGGIVLFGAPGTVVENNTILAQNQTLLGGINMVDYEPYRGDYSGTVVRNNRIAGAFANAPTGVAETKGVNTEHAIIKIGIAIGPRTWFGDRFGTNTSVSGTVTDNEFTGAFSYAMAVSSSRNFTVQNNVLVGNTSFIGAAGPNCSEDQTLPQPYPFVVDGNNSAGLQLQPDFRVISDGDALTCVIPPDGGAFWPVGGPPWTDGGSPSSSDDGTHRGSSGLTGGAIAGIVIGIVLGLSAVAALGWFARRRVRTRSAYGSRIMPAPSSPKA